MLPTELRCRRTGERLTLRRAWPRSPEHALVEYTGRDGVGQAGQWFADRQRLADVAAATPEPAYALVEDGVLLQPSGADRKLPAVQPLLRMPGARLVAHRAERRAVIADGAEYVKVVRARSAGAIVERCQIAAAFAQDLVGIAEVHAVDPEAGVLRLGRLPGRPLHDLGLDPAVSAGQFAAAWYRLGVLLRRLADRDPPDELPYHGPDEERSVTERWLKLASAYGVLPSSDTDRVGELLTGLPPAPPAIVHRDLHDKQVLVGERSGLSLLDLDTLALGDPAIDVANLLVHIELRRDQGLLSPAHAALATAALGAGVDLAGRDGLARRVEVYAAVARLRLRAVYAFRPSGRGRRPELQAQQRTAAAAVVADGQPAAGAFSGAPGDVQP